MRAALGTPASRRAVCAAAASACSVAMACAQIVGADGYRAGTPDGAAGGGGSGGGGGGTGCGLEFTNKPACTQCINASCCPQSSACANEPSCIPLNNCYVDCNQKDAGTLPDGGSSPCQTDCETKYKAGIDPLGKLWTCESTNCKTPCGIQ